MNKSISSQLRKLAKSEYYQTIFAQKEMGLKIFKNEIDLSLLQISFLNFLNFYSSLYLDYALGDIDDVVFTDEIYEDAYNFYRNKQRREPKTKKGNKEGQKAATDINWVFKTRK